ncbi:MAG: CRISPR-associated endoribonuclease Cas6 [Nitrospirae bacterium YQR-1]
MRLNFVFNHPVGTLSIDYNHLMQSWFSDFLSKPDAKCYEGKLTAGCQEKRKFKLFTFSKLFFDSYKVRGYRISFNRGNAQWFVSSPVKEFLNDFSAYMKNRKKISVNGVCFELMSIDEVQMPPFGSEMKFTSLSPITVTTEGLDEMNSDGFFLKFEDMGFIQKIKDSLTDKYRKFTGMKISNDNNFNFEFDSDYMERKRGRIQKKVKYERTEIVGYLAPFKVSAEPELLKFGYDTGFGDYCHMGFGMVKEI